MVWTKRGNGMNINKRTLGWKLSVLLLLLTYMLAAQNFPIRATVQVNGFSGQLESYDDPGRVLITLLNTDLRDPYEGLLRISLSGPGFSITTRETFLSTPILLPRNQPRILTGPELFDYFDPANLNFQGLSLENIQTEGGLLTEGPISLCVEIVDAVRFLDAPVSNTACTNGFLQLHRPPVILEPGEQVEAMMPQLLRFLWQPQHAGVPVVYTVEIYEDVLPGLSPELVIGATQPLLITETMNTAYLLTNIDPLLREGAKYYFRVRAQDVTNRASFLNNGWSNIHSFIYGTGSTGWTECVPLTTPYLAGMNNGYALLSWDTEERTAGMQVRYSPAVIPSWDTLPVGSATNFNLTNLGLTATEVAQAGQLSPSVLYMAQIQEQCAEGTWSAWSDPVYFHLNCSLSGALQVQDIVDQSATITSVNVANAVFYQFDFREQGSAGWRTFESANNAQIKLEELDAETTYEVRMRYWCSEGAWSNYSPVLQFTTLAPCPVPAGLSVAVQGEDAAQLNWRVIPQATETQSRYQLWSQPQAIWQVTTSTTNAIDLPNLDNGGIYQYQLRNECGTYFSDWTQLDTFVLHCGPPGQILASNVGETIAQLSASQRSFAATSTSFEYQAIGENTWQSAHSTNHTANLNNLQALTRYNVRAKATCQGGQESAYGDTIQFRTVIACSVPTGLVATNIEGNTATLSWDDQLGVTQWEIQYRPRIITTGGDNTIGTNTTSGGEGNSNSPPMTAGSGENRTPIIGGGSEGEEAPGNNEGQTTETTGQNTAGQGNGSNNTNTGESNESVGNQTEVELLVNDTTWTIVTTTHPNKLLANLTGNTAYEVKVRANCTGSGWTPFSALRRFRTPVDCAAPALVEVEDVFENSAKVVITPSSANTNIFLLHIRSTNPIMLIPRNSQYQRLLLDSTATTQTWQSGPIIDPVSNPNGTLVDSTASQQVWGSGPIWPPTSGNEGGNNDNFNNTFPRSVDTTLTIQTTVGDSIGIFMDSIMTNRDYATFISLLPDTEYEVSVRAYCADFGWTAPTAWVPFRTDICTTPEVIAEDIIDRNSARISWRRVDGDNDYVFTYRLADTPGADWVTINTTESSVLLEDLLSNAQYDYRVAEVCAGSGQLRMAPQDSFQLGRPRFNNGLYVCGLNTNIDLSNQIPLPQLVVDDTITAFDFPVHITMANGANGYFSGAGEIRLPYFNKAKFAFTFDSVFINDDYQLVNGYLGGTGFGVEVLPPWADSLLANILDVLGTLEESLSGDIVEVLQDIAALGANSNLPTALANDTHLLLDCLETAADAQARDICLQNADDLIQDLEDHLEELFAADYQVLFAAHPQQTYGFDGKGTVEPAEWYATRTIAGTDYYLPYKSIREGYPDQVQALVPSGRDSTTVFSQPSGEPLDTEDSGNGQTSLTFPGQTGNDYYLAAEQEVPDTTDHIAGLLQVVPYEQLPVNITLIPLSSAGLNLPIASLEQEVGRILGQAVIKPTLSITPVFNPSGYDGQLDAVNSGLLSAYTSEMNAIIDAYTQQFSPDENDYYLFLVDQYETTNRAGYMPRGRNFGFIYLGNAGTGQVLARTLTHELGHGAFVLEHTFDTYPVTLAEGTTTNLMDYPSATNNGGGTHLYKWQWDLMHDPVNAPLFPQDTTGEYVTVPMSSFDRFANKDSTYTFVSPGGMLVTLPKTVQSVSFYTGDTRPTSDSCGNNAFQIMPFGTLKFFAINEYTADGSSFERKTYGPCYGCSSDNFLGYVELGQPNASTCLPSLMYNDSLTRDLDSLEFGANAIVGFPCFNEGRIVMKIGQVQRPPNTTTWPPYLASGLIQPYTHLLGSYHMLDAEFQPNPTFVPPINATYGAAFLQKAEQYAGCADETALYVFAHLHQLNEHPNFFKHCGIDLVLDTETNIQEVTNRKKWWYTFLAAGSYGSGAANGGNSSIDFSQSEIAEIAFDGSELTAWEATDFSIYQAVDGITETIWSQTFFDDLDENDTDDQQRLFNAFKEYKDYPCTYIDLNLDNRLKCLRMLVHLDTFFSTDWMTNALKNYSPSTGIPGVLFQVGNNVEHEHVYNLLLKTAPIEDYSDILSFYRGEDGQFGQFYYVVDKMQDLWFNDVGYGEFSAILTYMLMEVEGAPEYQSHTNTNGTWVDIAGQQNANEHHAIGGYFPGYQVDWENGSAYLPTYSARIRNNKIRLGCVVPPLGAFPHISSGSLSLVPHFPDGFDIESNNPFEYVAFRIAGNLPMKNIATNWNLAIQGDSLLIVPYVWAAYIFERYEDALFEFSKRVVQDIMAIVAAIPSGGTSLTLLAGAEIAYKAGDIIFAAETFNFNVSGEEFIPPEVHQAWAFTGAAIGLAKAVKKVGLVKKGANGTIEKFRIGRLRTAVQELTKEDRQSLVKVGKSVFKLYKSAKSTYSKFRQIGRPAGVTSPEIWERFLDNFDREIDDLYLYQRKADAGVDPYYNNLRLALIQNPDSSYQDDYYQVFLQQGSVNIKGAGMMSRDNDLLFIPANWQTTAYQARDSISVVAVYDSLVYLNRLGERRVGALRIHYDPVNARVFVSEADILVDLPAASSLALVFTEKNWDWSVVNYRLGVFYTNLSTADQSAFRDLLRTWDDRSAGQAMFVSLQRDILQTEFGSFLEKHINFLQPWEILHNQSLQDNPLVLARLLGWYHLGLNITYDYHADGIGITESVAFAHLSSSTITYYYTGYGGDIVCPLDRTITLLVEDADLAGLKAPLNCLNWAGDDNPGGLNRLSNAQHESQQYSEDYLEFASGRGDMLRLLSDPNNPTTIWSNGIPPGQSGHISAKTRTGEDIEYLEGTLNYSLDLPSATYLPGN